jgi:methyl-accepting chemotaxis protein
VKEETVLEDGTEYSVGPYIVIGEGEMMKLAASSPSGDVEGDVAKLKVDVNKLQSNIVDVNEELNKKVAKEEGKRLMTDAEGTKLAGMSEGAQVNVIEKIVVNGTEVPVFDKVATMTIDIDIPEIENKVDGRVDNAYIDEIDGVKYLVLTFTEDANKEDILVDVSEMFSEQYSSGDGIDLKNMIIALKLGKNEKVLGFDADGGLIVNKDFTDRVGELESDLNDVIDTVINHSEKISGFTQAIPLIQETVDTLSKTVGEQGEDIADLQNDLSDLKDKIALKDGLIDEQISDINAKFDDYATLESVTELTEDVSTNAENITTLSNTVNTHNDKISGLTENVNNHTTKITEILEDINRIGEVAVEVSGNVENIVSDFEKVKVIYVENYAMAIKNATNDNIGQIIHLNKDSKVEEGTVYLKGYYFVEGEGQLSFIMTSDGTQDEIDRLDETINSLREKTDTIDAYTVNGQTISQDGGVVLESNDVIIGELPECEYKLNMVMSDDTIMSAIRKVENSLAATVIAMTASLNDLNAQINKLLEEKYVLKSEYDALVERVEALENAEKGE